MTPEFREELHDLWGQKLKKMGATGNPTMVLAVRACKAWAAPPGHGGQHLLLDPVHWLECHAVPGERRPAQQLHSELAEGLDEGPALPPCPTHMTLTFWQSRAPCGHGCCLWMWNFSVLQAAMKVTSLDFW